MHSAREYLLTQLVQWEKVIIWVKTYHPTNPGANETFGTDKSVPYEHIVTFPVQHTAKFQFYRQAMYTSMVLPTVSKQGMTPSSVCARPLSRI